ncbi:testis-expressed sequence 33 protein [Turdus rufiventris]|nr:testis-expressed sequence 33 protein [Turdus rufiventris]
MKESYALYLKTCRNSSGLVKIRSRMNAKSSAKIHHWVLDMGGPSCGSVIDSMEDFLPAYHLPIWNVENGGTFHMATGPNPQGGPACLYKPPVTTPGIMDQKCQAQDNEALGTEQKGPNNCNEMTKSSLAWASLSDYHQLGYNLAVNLFQGGPLRSQSLMRDSYTPDVFQKSTIDPRHWHGKKISELDSSLTEPRLHGLKLEEQ